MDATVAAGGFPDPADFAAIFFEEAAEHLAALESQLVALDPAVASDEDLNAIFRAAHSIKGGAATFGFRDMAEVTHELESLLDRARKRTLVLTPAMIDALLASSDVLAGQLAAHRGESDRAPEPDAVIARIRAFLGGPQAMAPDKAPRPTVAPAAAPTRRRYEILYPQPEGEAARAALANALAELGATGEPCEEAHGSAVGCALVECDLDADSLREALAFVLDVRGVTIIEREAAAREIVPFEDDSGGLFAPLPTPAAFEDEGGGLFEPLAPAEAAPAEPVAVAPASAVPSPAAPRARAANAEALSIRVNVAKVDQLVNQVGELVITQAMLLQQAAALDPMRHAALVNTVRDLERNTRDLQESVLSIRMMPIGSVFSRFPRMARELASQLGKQVALETDGESTEIDKGMIENIADPLTHLVRNAVDHGIELPEARIAAGKPAQGTVSLRAGNRGGSIVVEVADDGRGLDRAKLAAKARERGIAVRDDATDAEVYALIFEPGFSTAEKVTDVSGRGVGMDVVRRNIAALGGAVEIDSSLGHGTRITVRLPLTLAIMDGMGVAVGGVGYILPLAAVIESLRCRHAKMETLAGARRVARLRDEYIPVLSLADAFPPEGPARDASADPLMVVAEAEGQKVAFLVDELLGQQQVVVKSLEANYRRVPGISGATILGDGAVALILDVAALARRARQ